MSLREQGRYHSVCRVRHLDDLGAAGRTRHEHDGSTWDAQRLRQCLQRRGRRLTVDRPGTDSDHEGAVMRSADHGPARTRANPHDDSHPVMMPPIPVIMKDRAGSSRSDPS
jgi:hypothetical protein